MISWSYMCDLCMCGLSSSWYLVFQSKIIPVWMSLHRLGLNEVVWVGYPVVVIVSFSRNGPFPEMFGMIFNKMCCWNSATELPLQLDLVFRHYGCFCKWHTDIYVLFIFSSFTILCIKYTLTPVSTPLCAVCVSPHTLAVSLAYITCSYVLQEYLTWFAVLTGTSVAEYVFCLKPKAGHFSCAPWSAICVLQAQRDRKDQHL